MTAHPVASVLVFTYLFSRVRRAWLCAACAERKGYTPAAVPVEFLAGKHCADCGNPLTADLCGRPTEVH